MSTSKPFPILNLPLLPVLEILRTLDPVELLKFSECSTKSELNVKEVEQRVASQYKLFVSLGEKCSIGFQSDSPSKEMLFVPLPENCSIDRAQSECDKILRIFKGMKVRAEFSLDLNLVFDWAVKYKDNMEHIDYLGATNDQESLQKLLETFNHCTWSNGRFIAQPQVEIEKLVIDKANWFTMQNLCNFKGSFISVFGSSLTNMEVNQFLKNWKSGVWNNAGTKVVLIENEAIDIPRILEDMPHRTHHIDPRREKFQRFEVWYLLKHDGGAKVATIYRSKMFKSANILIHFQ